MDMEISEIIAYILSVLMPGIFVWNSRQQAQISDLKTEVAVNTSKDLQMWGLVEKMEDKLDTLIATVNDIKEEMARRKI